MDRKSNCSAYGKAFCSDPNYESFASQSCAKYCGKCKPPLSNHKTAFKKNVIIDLKKGGVNILF